MSDEMKATLKQLQTVIVNENPGAVAAVVHYSSGNWVEVEVTVKKEGQLCSATTAIK